MSATPSELPQHVPAGDADVDIHTTAGKLACLVGRREKEAWELCEAKGHDTGSGTTTTARRAQQQQQGRAGV